MSKENRKQTEEEAKKEETKREQDVRKLNENLTAALMGTSLKSEHARYD